MNRWRGRPDCFEQVGNAHDSFVDLTPASEAPAEQTRANWAAWLPESNTVPLIWEDSRHGYEQEEC